MRNKINLCVLMVIVVFVLVQADSLCADWFHQAKLTASDGNENDYFGQSVSISGEHAIVGADGDDDKGINSGSAYTFKYNGTTWSEQAKLIASDGSEGDLFGRSVSISGDHAIVGASKNGTSGSAYIFQYDGITWSEQQKLNPSYGGKVFGYSVSISGDYAIVGDCYDDDKGYDSGSAYIFKYDGANWSQEAKLTASDGAEDDYFGVSVSISGNYAIVGADGDDDKGTYSGSAYIFKYDGTTWVQHAKLTASDGAEGDYLGHSVSISADYAIVGAGGDNDKGVTSGSAYIFKYDGTTWSQQQKLTASDGSDHDNFGISVSISGDHAIASTEYDDDKGESSGSSYIFMNGMPCWHCPWQPYGDIIGDGSINAADYFIFKKSYGTGWATHSHGEMIGQYNCCCDLNHDLKVNATDYFIFKKNYGRTELRRCAISSCL